MNDGQTKHGEQAEALYKLCAQQLAEHKEWLRQVFQEKLAQPSSLAAKAPYARLCNAVDEITFVRAAPEKVVTSEGVGTEISITYNYPDELVSWLQKNLPEALAGGTVLKTSKTPRPSNR